ncbi:MAG: hypothetical protein ABW003_12975 [Microvirga sp.]
MIPIHETFATRQEAEAFRDRMYREWHPAGYGTRIDITQAPDGTWIASGHRFDTCD